MRARGVSAVVATVFLILISISAVVIVGTLVVPLVQDNLEQSSRQQDGELTVLTHKGYTYYVPDNQSVSVQVEQEGFHDVSEMKIILSFDGSTEYVTKDVPGHRQVKRYLFKLSDERVPNSVSVAPLFPGGGEGTATVATSIPRRSPWEARDFSGIFEPFIGEELVSDSQQGDDSGDSDSGPEEDSTEGPIYSEEILGKGWAIGGESCIDTDGRDYARKGHLLTLVYHAVDPAYFPSVPPLPLYNETDTCAVAVDYIERPFLPERGDTISIPSCLDERLLEEDLGSLMAEECSLYRYEEVQSCSGEDCFLIESYCADANNRNDDPAQTATIRCRGGCSDGVCLSREPAIVCGNGLLESGEMCDDGNRRDLDGCTSECLLEESVSLCEFTSADWSRSNQYESSDAIREHENIGVDVMGTEACANLTVYFEVQEVDGLLDDPVTLRLPQPNVFHNGRANSDWAVQWQCDGGRAGVCFGGNPEYTFTAYLGLEPSKRITSATEISPERSSAVCGDFIVQAGEQCDDGNVANGDGCSDTCFEEDIVLPFCGNGIIEEGEQCDDSNVFAGDGCDDICRLEVPVEPVCGNGIIEEGEQCDDSALGGATCTLFGYDSGTLTCSNDCEYDTGACVHEEVSSGCELTSATWSTLQTVEGTQVTLRVSGSSECNGEEVRFSIFEVDVGEDDPVRVNPPFGTFVEGQATASWTAEWQCDGAGCIGGDPEYMFVATLVDDPTYTISTSDELTVSEASPTCGNNLVQDGEQCDDGNTNNGDGCSAACMYEVCGNGIQDASEQCDDGNTFSGDGCDSSCQGELDTPSYTDCSTGRVGEYICIDSVVARQGEQLEIPVRIALNSQKEAARINSTYDSGLMDVTGIERGPLTENAAMEMNAGEGLVQMAIGSSDELGRGILVYIDATALSPGTGVVSFDQVMFDEDPSSLGIASSGQVTFV